MTIAKKISSWKMTGEEVILAKHKIVSCCVYAMYISECYISERIKNINNVQLQL